MCLNTQIIGTVIALNSFLRGEIIALCILLEETHEKTIVIHDCLDFYLG
jgi:hypothetical protein